MEREMERVRETKKKRKTKKTEVEKQDRFTFDEIKVFILSVFSLLLITYWFPYLISPKKKAVPKYLYASRLIGHNSKVCIKNREIVLC